MEDGRKKERQGQNKEGIREEERKGIENKISQVTKKKGLNKGNKEE